MSDFSRVNIFSTLFEFFGSIQGGSHVFCEFIKVNNEHELMEFKSVFDVIDNSYIDDLISLKGFRNSNIFKLFLDEMTKNSSHAQEINNGLNLALFHLHFARFFEEKNNQFSLGGIIQAYFDCYVKNEAARIILASEMRRRISETKIKNIQSEWFHGAEFDEKLKALIFYAEKYLPLKIERSDLIGIDAFFDSLNWTQSKEYVSHHFSKIKSLYNNRKHRKNSNNTQINLQLSSKASKEIDRLAKLFGVNRSSAVEILLLNAKDSGADKFILERINVEKEVLLKIMKNEGRKEIDDDYKK